jgi:pimeloyl-ACP methyl ester carboxylesterase
MHGTRYSVRDLASDSAALIRALHLKNATVLGWSMGGIVAQQLAIDEPSLISKLILCRQCLPARALRCRQLTLIRPCREAVASISTA